MQSFKSIQGPGTNATILEIFWPKNGNTIGELIPSYARYTYPKSITPHRLHITYIFFRGKLGEIYKSVTITSTPRKPSG
jgi:hypothetical protein